MSLRTLFIYTFLLSFIAVGFYACDSTTAPENPLADSPSIASFEITPTSIEFTMKEDGFKDTTITVELYSMILNGADSDNVLYAFSDKSSGEVVAEGELTSLESPEFNYSAEVDIETTTTSSGNYTVSVFFENNPSVYAQTGFSSQGFSNDRPEILKTAGPNLINRPSSGQIPAVFTAKVTDADGQETIDQVYIRVINQASGEVEGSPFQMFDDGTTYNDSTANDSIYTWSQNITPTDQNPDRDFNIEFYAIDQAGLSSDTVRTTFRIRE